ncbi:hypothetical protein DENSPDRAFT_640609 [Dentipellis sp. KUC8613]|nr:hypothetical protein DENSPDRAFT_640609 [Dentipellis sp. KUC8613]
MCGARKRDPVLDSFCAMAPMLVPVSSCTSLGLRVAWLRCNACVSMHVEHRDVLHTCRPHLTVLPHWCFFTCFADGPGTQAPNAVAAPAPIYLREDDCAGGRRTGCLAGNKQLSFPRGRSIIRMQHIRRSDAHASIGMKPFSSKGQNAFSHGRPFSFASDRVG